MAYGFKIHAEQDVVKTMRDIEKSMYSMSGTVDNNTRHAEASIERMGETARTVGRYIAEAFAIRELIHYGREIMNISAEFEGFTNVIKYSSKNSYDAGQNLEFIQDVVTRLHLPLKEAMQGFSEMQAGLIGTGIEGENLRKVFEGISTAGAVLHLPVKNLEMILYDFKEIGERGLNMRNWMSLSGWFPGIGNIVHETFGKGFHELKEEGMAPGIFLSKLGEGMSKHFASGLPNAGNSLIAQMNDTKNAMTTTFLKMGEELRPIFTSIMQQLRAVFNSDLARTFINNLRPMVEVLMTLGKAWVFYKVAVFGAGVAMSAYAKVLEIVETLQALQMVQMSKLEFLATSLGAVPLGAIFGGVAIAVGFAVNEVMNLNAQMEETLEKFSHLKELQGEGAGADKQYERSTNFFKNRSAHTADEKGENLNEMEQLVKTITKHMGTVSDQYRASKETMDSYNKNAKHYSGPLSFDNRGKYYEQMEQQKKLYENDKAKLAALNSYIKSLKAEGVKPYVQTMPQNTEIKNGSLHTMGLAGAKGGLGEAKNVNIHIGTMQKIDVKTPAAIKLAAEDGMEVLLRVLNNLAYGRSATM